MIFALLIIYQIKHFLCDFPFQTPYMMGKFKGGCEWIGPLSAHAGAHAIATTSIALFFKPELALVLGMLDFFAHFCVDRVKASPRMLGRFKALSGAEYVEATAASRWTSNHPELEMHKKNAFKRLKSNTYFWWALGADQMAHHLTHYLIIFLLLR
jgi:hypothetical protein